MTSIQNFSNYLIYNNGDIYSVKRKIFLKPRYDKNGYPRVGIVSDDKKNITLRLHQLVCMAYLDFELEGTSGSKLVIDHIDNNKNNNYLRTFNTELEAHFAYKTAVEPLMQNVIT
jgi:hypothetical protein